MSIGERDGREPRFDRDFAYGRQAELWVDSVVDALKDGAGYEVKCDAVSLRTGNLYVEFRCFRQGKWRKSGLAETTSEVTVFSLGTTGLALMIGTQRLRDICLPLYRAGRVRCETDGSHPTAGVLLPIAHLVNETRRTAA